MTFLESPLAIAILDPSLLRLKCRGLRPPEGISDMNSSIPQLSGFSVISESLWIMVLLLGSGLVSSKIGPRRLPAMMNLLSGVCGVLVAHEVHGKRHNVPLRFLMLQRFLEFHDRQMC
jgi:hypothetical protein